MNEENMNKVTKECQSEGFVHAGLLLNKARYSKHIYVKP